jgi:GH35 family endo-1,4-beta-xylanase
LRHGSIKQESHALWPWECQLFHPDIIRTGKIIWMRVKYLFYALSLLLLLSLGGCSPTFIAAMTVGSTYDGAIMAGADARIEQYRKGALVVQVRDTRGQPVPEAQVQVEQTRHAFLFGVNVFNLDPQNEASWQRSYQNRLLEVFNYATLPFYWAEVEPRQGQRNYARLDRMVRWLEERQFNLKGHPLVWSFYNPNWIPRDPDQTIELLRERVNEIIQRYKGSIKHWDVVNEANNFQETNGVQQWLQRDGAVVYVVTALEWARTAGRGSDLTLIYNDYETGPFVSSLYAELARLNRLPDAFGIQSHMHEQLWGIREVWERADRIAQFGRPIRFTEISVLSGANISWDRPRPRSWPSTPEGEAIQADYVENLYRVLFSHPRVEAITWWDLSDLNAWMGAPAGLLRADMSPKPAYERLKSLIKGQWWTKAQGKTDKDGVYRTRAFLGSYRVTVSAGGQSQIAIAEVNKNEDGETILNVLLGR